MRRLQKKIFKHLRWNNRDDVVPRSRADNDPSLRPSAKIAAPQSQVSSLNDPSSSPTPSSPHPVQNGSNNTSLQNTDEGTKNQKKNYWQLAIDKLRDEDPSFSDAITSLQKAAEKEGLHFTDQLLKSTEQAHERVTSRRWEFKIGDKTIVPRDQLGKVVAVIDLFKDAGDVASSFDRTFAGLPWTGFCVLLHLATSDSKQYMDMVTGAQEVATVILRYKEIEGLYVSRPETDLREKCVERLVSLYMNIIRYQIAAASYYGRSTTLRFLRAIPKLDDVSDIIEAIQRDDAVCKDLAQAFQLKDTSSILPEMLTKLDRVEAKLPEPHSISPDAPWIVPRQANALFMGRREILMQIEEAIRHNLHESARCEPCRIVITGMGGQGKSEICLQIANRMRNLFQGVFWIDVSSDAMAEAGFMNIAKAIHYDADNLEEALQAISNFRKPWLVVLDNADDPSIDYQAYFPTGTHGVVLMTSRNFECSRYATLLRSDMTLKGLDDASARDLLLKAANISPDGPALYEDAQKICTLLMSHPLALIQAGSFVARGHCTLHQYPERFQSHCMQILKSFPKQAQPRYGHVYATFEASAEVLQSSSDEAAQDALEILSMLSMISYSPLPLAIFQATWQGARKIKKNPSKKKEIHSISKQHVEQLICLINVDVDEWDQDRLIEAISCLKSLSLITADEKNGCIRNISIHPLIHAWAKERQTIVRQYQSWITTGSIFAISSMTNNLWVKYERQLKPHLQAYLDCKVSDMLNRGPFLMVIQIIMSCARVLTDMREDSRLPSLLEDLFKTINLDNKTLTKRWELLYHLYGINLRERGKITDAIQLLEEAVNDKGKTLDPQDPIRLASLQELARAYRANGETTKAIALLEEVKITRNVLDPEHPDRLLSQHLLATAYLDNGQTNEAMSLLKEVIQIRERTLASGHRNLLTSRHELAKAYLANGQTKEAISRLEEVVKIRQTVLNPEHPSRLASQHSLATAYFANGQTMLAISCLEPVIKIQAKVLDPNHPSLLTSRHELGKAYLANGQTKEAISCLEEVVKIREETLRSDHPSQLESQHQLARAYLANGQAMLAISRLEEVVEIRRTVLNPDHPSLLASQHSLATAYLAIGQTMLAISLLEDVIEIQAKVLDPKHPSLLTSRHELGKAYLAIGQTTRAISCLEEVVKIRQTVLKPDHPSQLESQHQLARAYLDNGQTKEAISCLEEVVNIRKKTLNFEHPSWLASQRSLATAYLADGQTMLAISCLEPVIKIQAKVLDPNHPSLLTSRHELGKAYLANGQTKEAISCLEEVVKIREETLRSDHPSQLESQHQLARAYLANGQAMLAISRLEEVVEIRRTVLNPEHPSRLASQHSLATAYLATGPTMLAISCLEDVIEIQAKVLDPKHPSLLTSRHELGKAYLANGQTTRAISCLEEVVKIRQTVLKPDHPSQLESQHQLARAYLANGQPKKALSHFEKATLRRDDGENRYHPTRLAALHESATLCLANGKFRRAIFELWDAIEIEKNLLGINHPDVLASIQELVQAYLAAGSLSEAISDLEDVLQERTVLLGRDHPFVIGLKRTIDEVR